MADVNENKAGEERVWVSHAASTERRFSLGGFQFIGVKRRNMFRRGELD